MIRLEKYHASGNDFLVLLDASGTGAVDERLARAVCDRHTGVGADGLLRARRAGAGSGADVVMDLWNADGSPAETSGNGLRCLALAVVDAGWPVSDALTVLTGAGVKRVWFDGDLVSVDMGRPKITAGDGDGALVDLGNPHLVMLVDDPTTVELERLGRQHADLNVEVVSSTLTPSSLVMRVHERGVGETLACGSGACAAAAVAHDLGLVGERVTVYQPGGPVSVEIGDTVVLTGPAVHVASVEVCGT
jgi:diaminopimelate epimerase